VTWQRPDRVEVAVVGPRCGSLVAVELEAAGRLATERPVLEADIAGGVAPTFVARAASKIPLGQLDLLGHPGLIQTAAATHRRFQIAR
jgi:hypothetical protein